MMGITAPLSLSVALLVFTAGITSSHAQGDGSVKQDAQAKAVTLSGHINGTKFEISKTVSSTSVASNGPSGRDINAEATASAGQAGGSTQVNNGGSDGPIFRIPGNYGEGSFKQAAQSNTESIAGLVGDAIYSSQKSSSSSSVSSQRVSDNTLTSTAILPPDQFSGLTQGGNPGGTGGINLPGVPLYTTGGSTRGIGVPGSASQSDGGRPYRSDSSGLFPAYSGIPFAGNLGPERGGTPQRSDSGVQFPDASGFQSIPFGGNAESGRTGGNSWSPGQILGGKPGLGFGGLGVGVPGIGHELGGGRTGGLADVVFGFPKAVLNTKKALADGVLETASGIASPIPVLGPVAQVAAKLGEAKIGLAYGAGKGLLNAGQAIFEGPKKLF